MAVAKAIEPFVYKHPKWVTYSALGSKYLGVYGWNNGIKKNIPRHYAVIKTFIYTLYLLQKVKMPQ